MVSYGSRWGLVIPLLVVTVLAFAPSVYACTESPGQIYVASGTPTPPPFSSCATGGINVACVPATPGLTFSLAAHAPINSVCVLSQCTVFPDFNIAWYKAGVPFDTQIGYSGQPGNEGGQVPQGAAYGLVYMRYGPDVLGDDSGGARFTYKLDC